jgi:hypothetical protein
MLVWLVKYGVHILTVAVTIHTPDTVFYFSNNSTESKAEVEENIFLGKWTTLPSLTNEINSQALTTHPTEGSSHTN